MPTLMNDGNPQGRPAVVPAAGQPADPVDASAAGPPARPPIRPGVPPKLPSNVLHYIGLDTFRSDITQYPTGSDIDLPLFDTGQLGSDPISHGIKSHRIVSDIT